MSCLDFHTCLIGHVMRIDSLKRSEPRHKYIHSEGRTLERLSEATSGRQSHLPSKTFHLTCHTNQTKKQSSTKVLIKHSLPQTHTLPPAPQSQTLLLWLHDELSVFNRKTRWIPNNLTRCRLSRKSQLRKHLLTLDLSLQDKVDLQCYML